MRPSWAWWGGTLVLATAATLTALAPGWRLERERAAALREGLLLELPNQPTNPRLLRLLEKWRGAQYAGAVPVLSIGIARLLRNEPAPGDRRRVLVWKGLNEAQLAEWREFSEASALEFSSETAWLDPLTGGEVDGVRTAGQALATAAALGRSPRPNLLAASRLAGLLRAEPGCGAAGEGALLGIECLNVARPLGLSREVDAALGPPSDPRRALRLDLPILLEIAERKDPPLGFMDMLEDHNPFAPDPRLVAIARWRRLWSELPRDPTDLDGAARVVETLHPDVVAEKGRPISSGMIPTTFLRVGMEAASLRCMSRFETLRRQERAR